MFAQTPSIRPMTYPTFYYPNMDDYSRNERESIIPLLTAFDTVASEGHVTRAAARLGVPQSSVSRRIHSLEKTLGIDLFHPVGRGVALTVSGRELHDRTHHLIAELDDAVGAVVADTDPDTGVVRFGCPLTLGARALTSLLADFHRNAPRIRIRVTQAHGESLAEMIRDGRLDIAVLIPPPDDLDAETIGAQQVLLHVARTHRLAKRAEVHMHELADEHFVASPPSFQLRSLLDEWCTDAGFQAQVLFEINEIDTIRALVRTGMGVALLPAAERPDRDVVAITLAGHHSRTVGLVAGRHQPTKAAARFRTFLVAYPLGIV